MRRQGCTGDEIRTPRAHLAGFLLVALAVCGHLIQTLHHSRHDHAVVGGKLVHRTAHRTADRDEVAPARAGLPTGHAVDVGIAQADDEDETCHVPPPDRVRPGSWPEPPPCSMPLCSPRGLNPGRAVARIRDVLAYAPKHSPPTPRS